ncbi:hypothetical protein [Thiobacillus sp.]|uniref:hypothetical protein n=1 Tax=Thiobacillus sp. TaxID=924 RepID=UPI0025EE4785|nr:hypothetical protein [Thiobacillus sp.]
MTKISNLACMMATMLYLATGIAHAADDAETQQAGPTVASTSENPAKPKENAASTNSAQSSTTETKEEPACN